MSRRSITDNSDKIKKIGRYKSPESNRELQVLNRKSSGTHYRDTYLRNQSFVRSNGSIQKSNGSSHSDDKDLLKKQTKAKLLEKALAKVNTENSDNSVYQK